jgi:hypothetical protein
MWVQDSSTTSSHKAKKWVIKERKKKGKKSLVTISAIMFVLRKKFIPKRDEFRKL